MLAWQVQSAPVASPAHGMHSAPVWTATRPCASTTPTWRTAASSSAASSVGQRVRRAGAVRHPVERVGP